MKTSKEVIESTTTVYRTPHYLNLYVKMSLVKDSKNNLYQKLALYFSKELKKLVQDILQKIELAQNGGSKLSVVDILSELKRFMMVHKNDVEICINWLMVKMKKEEGDEN